MPRNELEIVLRLRDEATRALKRAQGALKGLEGGLKRAKAAANRMWAELDRMSGSLATIAGAGGAAYALAAFAKEAYKAEVGTRLFVRQLERMKQDVEAGQRELKRIADRLGVLPDQIADYATQLLRQGLTMRDITTLFEGAAASALAAGKDVLTGIDAVTNAIVNQQSIYLNYAGIAENLDVAYREYAKTLGKTVDALTKEERARAAVLLVQRATKEEVADLDTLLGGLTGKQNRLNKELAEFRRTLGRLVLPSLERLLDVTTEALDAINRAPPWLKEAGASFAVMGTAISGVAVGLGLLRSAILPFLGPVGWFMLAASGAAALTTALSSLNRESDPASRALRSVRNETERLRDELRKAKDADDLIAKLEALGQTLTGPAKEAWTQYIQEAKKSKQEIKDIAKAAEEAIAKFLAVQRVAVESSLKEAQAAFEWHISTGLGKKAFERFPKWIKDGIEQAAKEGGLSLLRMIDEATNDIKQQLEGLRRELSKPGADTSWVRRRIRELETYQDRLNRLRPLAEKWAAAQAKLNALQEQEKRILAALNNELGATGDRSNKAGQGIKGTGDAAQKAAADLDKYAAEAARLNRELHRFMRAEALYAGVDAGKAFFEGLMEAQRRSIRDAWNRQTFFDQFKGLWGADPFAGVDQAVVRQVERVPGYRRRHGGLGAEMRAQAEAARSALEAASKLTATERDRRQALAEIRAEQERLNELARQHLELQRSLLRAREQEIARMKRILEEASKLTQAELDRRRAAREIAGMPSSFQETYEMYAQYGQLRRRSRQARAAYEERRFREIYDMYAQYQQSRLAARQAPGGKEADVLGGFLSGITKALGALNPFAAILQKINPLAEILAAMLEKLQPVLEPITEVLVEIGGILADLLAPALKAITPIIRFFGRVIRAVAEVVAGIWNAIARAINAILGWLGVHLELIKFETEKVKEERRKRDAASKAPTMAPAIRYELPTAPVLAAPSWVDEMGRHVARFGEAVNRFASTVSAGDLAYSVRGLA